MRASTPAVPEALAQCPKGAHPEGKQARCDVLADCQFSIHRSTSNTAVANPALQSGHFDFQDASYTLEITRRELTGNRDQAKTPTTEQTRLQLRKQATDERAN